MKILAALLLVGSALSTANAATYIPQASFNVAGSTVAGMDRDAAGNLYVLARVPGTSTSYTVSSYQTPTLAPEFSFGVTITTALAFAVEANGFIDILDAGNGLTLTRFDNAGDIISQVSRIAPYGGNYFTGALDKTNSLFYLSYPNNVIQATGDFSFKVLYTQGAISQYNYSGQLQRTFDLPGRTTISTTCYTPSMMSVDDQGAVWIVDPVCNQLFAYSSLGAQAKDISLPYAFFPEFLWNGPGENVFITHAVCSPSNCLQIQGVEFDNAGVQQNTFPTSSYRGEAWDSRILYMALPSGATVQRFILDSSPTAPIPSSPQGFVLQHSSMATLSWQASTDADGDALLYSIYIGTSPSQLNFAGSTSLTLFVSTPLAFGTTYYWQATAQDSYLGLPMNPSTAPLVGFGLSFLNNPPGSFAVASGTGTVVTRNTSAKFGWTAAIDPDGDPVTYVVSWLPAGQSSATVITTGANSLAVTGLAFGATDYWSVKACDPYGACTPMSGVTQTYDPVFLNSPPPAPMITGGAGIIGEHSLSPTVVLSWTAVIDPDADPVSYQVEFATAIGNLLPVQLGTATSESLTGLSLNTTYYWAVTASDPYDAASTSTIQSLRFVLQNNPPGAFAIVSGTGTLASRTTAQMLAWGTSTDPDGDLVTYSISLSTAPGSLAVVQTSTATSYLLSFQNGTTYYWNVAAFDGFGGTSTLTGGTQGFLPTFLDQAPQAVQIPPQPVVTTMSGSATITWQQVTNSEGDPVSYTVYFGDSAGDLQAFAVISPASGGAAAQSVRVLNTRPQAQSQIAGSTITLTLTGLDYYHAYYLQVQAANQYGAASMSPVQTFTLGSASGFPAAYNYPNPFSSTRSGTNIVFNAPPSGYAKATVEVYSEWQALLFKQDYFNIPPGVSQVPFNGQDRSGRPLFNGSYICRVRFSGPDDQAIFYLLVVK